MRSLPMIVVVAAAFAGCPSRKPADRQPPLAPVTAPAPPPLTPAPQAAVDASPAPARTELDRSHGFAIEEDAKPKLVAGAYVWPCPLPGLEDASISIAKNRRLTLSNGSRTLSALKLDDDFFAPETQVICQKAYVTIRREKDERYREAGFAWDHKHLTKTARSEGLIPPVRGP